MLLEIIEFLKMVDGELYFYIEKFGLYIYLLLFAVVFSKTAFVLLTFLPGDSLVFASGTLAAIDKLNVFVLFFIYFVATTLADSNNFLIGYACKKLPASKRNLFRLIPNKTIEQARKFLNNYGRIAITFARFVPLMRTMTPFISGYTGYSYWKFLRYNAIGALFWVSVWLGSGFLLGNIKWVANNLILTMTIISLTVFIPAIFAYVKQFIQNKSAKEAA